MFENYCENCGQEVVKPAEIPQGAFIARHSVTSLWAEAGRHRFPCFLTSTQSLELHSLKRLSHQVPKLSLFHLALLWLHGRPC